MPPLLAVNKQKHKKLSGARTKEEKTRDTKLQKKVEIDLTKEIDEAEANPKDYVQLLLEKNRFSSTQVKVPIKCITNANFEYVQEDGSVLQVTPNWRPFNETICSQLGAKIRQGASKQFEGMCFTFVLYLLCFVFLCVVACTFLIMQACI